jgi:hypothetical protein
MMTSIGEKAVVPDATAINNSYPAAHDNRSSTGSEDQDVANAIVGDYAHEIDPVVERRVVRKIDCFLIPAMIIGYGLVYYDKVSCHYRIGGIHSDLFRRFLAQQPCLE